MIKPVFIKPGEGMTLKPYRGRILLRTLRFVAYYWWLPFLAGFSFAYIFFLCQELEVDKRWFDAFEQSFQTVINSCSSR